MVLELRVLFGIEHFEQRRGRITPEILPQLVDFIEQEQRVHRFRLAQIGHDLAWQRSDIGPPMAADFGLVTHPAQRLADKLAPGRLGNRFAQAGLAHARRPDQAQDRTLQLVGARLHRQIFDDPVFDFVERIMIGIEHVLRRADVTLQLATLAPRQTQQHVEIVTDHGRFGRHRLHRAQLFQLCTRLRTRVLGQFELVDAFGQLVDFVAAPVVAAAQFGLDRLQLLVEVVFALGLFHLALDPATDLAFDLQHAKLALHEREDHFQPLERVDFGQHGLLVAHFGGKVGSNRVG